MLWRVAPYVIHVVGSGLSRHSVKHTRGAKRYAVRVVGCITRTFSPTAGTGAIESKLILGLYLVPVHVRNAPKVSKLENGVVLHRSTSHRERICTSQIGEWHYSALAVVYATVKETK